MGFSLKKGADKLEKKRSERDVFLKFGDLLPMDRGEFVVSAVAPPPEGLNLACIVKLKTPVNGKSVWGISKTTWLMIAKSWPDDDTDSWIGSTFHVRTVTTPSRTGKPYSTLHIYGITKKGAKTMTPIAELPRGSKVADDEPPPYTDADCPF